MYPDFTLFGVSVRKKILLNSLLWDFSFVARVASEVWRADALDPAILYTPHAERKK